jgi:hypothetical protein
MIQREHYASAYLTNETEIALHGIPVNGWNRVQGDV